jgi:hypothetical protein
VPFYEILDKASLLIGSQVEINGFLIMIGQNIYIVLDKDSLRNTNRSFLIQHPDFDKKLYSSGIPAWGGGDLVFCSPVTAKGTLCNSNNSLFPIALTEIISAIVNEEDEVIKVI